jgi:hypothetical protein
VEGTATRDQSIYVRAIAAVVLVMALYCLYASTPRDRLQRPQPPSVHFIKCAAASVESPCGLDPAMQRLGFPQPLPFEAPPPTPRQFVPSR